MSKAALQMMLSVLGLYSMAEMPKVLFIYTLTLQLS